MEKVMRKIITIDESKCDGCGLCIPSCAEGALQIVNGKARLVKDAYCDGLGNCLGECPQGAIDIVEREAEPFDEEAVEEHLQNLKQEENDEESGLKFSCPGSSEWAVNKNKSQNSGLAVTENRGGEPEAELSHWPIQLDLVSPEARFLKGCDLLIAADCVPFAYADFHHRFLVGHALVIGCPKLDDTEGYLKKLSEIFKANELNSITVLHMEVGCCYGLSGLVRSALQESGKEVPLKEIVIGVDGSIKK